MEINTDKTKRRNKAMDDLCPYPSHVKGWVIWRIGFRHGSSGDTISPNGTPVYRDGYKSGGQEPSPKGLSL